MIGSGIHQVIANNQPTQGLIINVEIPASQVCFPPPKVSEIISDKWRFVVSLSERILHKPHQSFMVQKVEGVRPLSSADTIISATSWVVD